MPADDLTDPAPATTFAHLDATTVLSRQIAELGVYPAVDPLDSSSRIMDPVIVGDEHYRMSLPLSFGVPCTGWATRSASQSLAGVAVLSLTHARVFSVR